MKNKIILILTLILVIGCVFAIPAFASTDSSDANVSTDTPPVVGGDEQQTFTVIFYSNGGTEIAPVTVDKMAKLDEPEAPTRDGYEFAGWYYNHEAWNFDENIVYDNITLTAQWTKNQSINFGFNIAALVQKSEFNGNTIQSPLAMMGLGMAGIFVVTLVIVGAVILLNKLNLGDKKDENN